MFNEVVIKNDELNCHRSIWNGVYTLFKCFKKNNVSMRRLLNSYIMRLLENKITLITGAGRGIGRVIAEQFAKDGATVYVNDLQEGDMQLGQMIVLQGMVLSSTCLF